MKTPKKRSDCPVSYSLEAFGDKWSLLIVRDLMLHKKCTYGELAKSDEKIATNILAARLLSLEENGIIQKLEHPESKAKVLYQLTQKGIDLIPIIVEINLWAEKYTEIPESRKELVAQMNADKEGFIRKSIDELTTNINF
ncbi:helix-turn-helix domain-containing protein [Flavobacterium sp. SORGH_AS_0622]|jgi:DNA-binding HxlR family transcriptional regulator|uniref:winged helix-turn-helix transcriptional regulator n=1 Tax=Flavobacterium sp. SORGH_AS_0622 TaxID=3041772 RepID=UPI0027846810|nr:helix-turn-helix domain-containing protein [Flavobacterium sp. SORGH_AS_0622]MDQ1166102.1 DNA-binding HxlR family transcriptional regulator [Flavobacterium sp. SORGH_AS_0622]